MISGLLPVGRPSTNGFSGVGLKVWMRPALDISRASQTDRRSVESHTDDVLGNVLGHALRVFTDDHSPACWLAAVAAAWHGGAGNVHSAGGRLRHQAASLQRRSRDEGDCCKSQGSSMCLSWFAGEKVLRKKSAARQRMDDDR